MKKNREKSIHRHKKIYAPYILTSMPPQHPWICEICGEEGIDTEVSNFSKYMEIKRKFKI